MAFTCYWLKNKKPTEFAVTLLKPLKNCTTNDLNKSAFAASYDQINNVAYCGTVPQYATMNRSDTVWYRAVACADLDLNTTVYFSSVSNESVYRRTLILAVPLGTQITSYTKTTLPDNVYLVFDVQADNKLIYTEPLTDMHLSTPLRHCLDDTVFSYAKAADTISDGTVNYQLYPVLMYVMDGHTFITPTEPYSTPTVYENQPVCGFTEGIPCFDDSGVKLCLGSNPNTQQHEQSLALMCSDNGEYDSVTIANTVSSINSNVKIDYRTISQEPNQLCLHRDVVLSADNYNDIVAQYGFTFVNTFTGELYEPTMRDRIVEGYKQLVNTPVKLRSSKSINSNNIRTVPPAADAQVSNEREYYTVGIGVSRTWQVRKYSINDLENPTIVEDLGAATLFKAVYIEADGTFEYFAGDDHLSLVTEGMPWLVLIRASDNALYVKRVGADIDTAYQLDTDVEQASVCRGWKSDVYKVDAGLIVAYRKANGVYIRVHHPVKGTIVWDTAQTITDEHVDHVEVKRLNDFRIGIFTTNPNKLYLSERYYIGGTTKTEYLEPEITSDFSVFSFTAEDGPHDDLAIESVVLRNHQEFWVKANYPFYWRDTTWNDVSTLSVPAGFSIDSYRIEQGYLVIRMNQPYSSANIHNEFRIRALNRIRFYRTEHSIPICPQIDIIYDLPAEGYTTETLTPVITGSWSFAMKPQETMVGYHIETLRPNITGTVQIVARPANDIPNTNTERLNVAITNATVTIAVEQTGVTPV